MKRSAGLLLALVLLTAAGRDPVASSLDRFRYQPKKIRVGEVAHYVKSNLDGSKPARVSIYVAAPDRLEVAKVEKGVRDAAWVRAGFNWKLFTADKLDAAVIALDGSVEERASLDVDRKAGVVNVKLGDRTGSAAWRHVPFHVYNFDFTSLNFAWRHLADPKAPFEIGILDPTFKAEGEPFFYRGEARIEYVGEEKVHDESCLKYRISGAGIGDKTGTIWANPKTGWLQRVEIPFPDNPGWDSFRLELEGIEKMAPQDWKSFITTSLAKANRTP
jgi:hypothetical protein